MTREVTDKVKDLMTDAAMETTEAIKDKVIKKWSNLSLMNIVHYQSYIYNN